MIGNVSGLPVISLPSNAGQSGSAFETGADEAGQPGGATAVGGIPAANDAASSGKSGFGAGSDGQGDKSTGLVTEKSSFEDRLSIEEDPDVEAGEESPNPYKAEEARERGKPAQEKMSGSLEMTGLMGATDGSQPVPPEAIAAVAQAGYMGGVVASSPPEFLAVSQTV